MPPDGWFWGKLHVPRAGLRKLGFRYVDPHAGPSFRVLCDLGPEAGAAAEMARRNGFAMDHILRLGAHETLRSHPGSPPEIAAFHAKAFESGGASGAIVWQLSEAEHAELGLPLEPPWAAMYRGEAPAPVPAAAAAPRAPIARRGSWNAAHWIFLGIGGLVLSASLLALANPPIGTMGSEYPIVVLVTMAIGLGLVGWITATRWGFRRVALPIGALGAVMLGVLGVRYVASAQAEAVAEERAARYRALYALCDGGAGLSVEPLPGTAMGLEMRGAGWGYSAADQYSVRLPDGATPEHVVCVRRSEETIETAAFEDPRGGATTLQRARELAEVRVIRVRDAALLGSSTFRGSDPRGFGAWEEGSLMGPPADPAEIRAFAESVMSR